MSVLRLSFLAVALLTVPPYAARSPQELLLPSSVVEQDRQAVAD